MKQTLRGKHQQGSITLALTVMVLALVSGVTMVSLGVSDNGILFMENEGLQQFHFVRTELQRGQTVLSELQLGKLAEILPIRKLLINHGFGKRTYVMKTTVQKDFGTSSQTVSARQKIRTKIKSYNRSPEYVSYDSRVNKDIVERYAEKVIQRETFAGYMYLTNTDESVNGDEVYFNGHDEIWGRVHSNTTIHLQNVDGWPVFHSLVSTAEVIEPHNTVNDPSVFMAGVLEHAGIIEFNPNADEIKDNGARPWGLIATENTPDIVMVELGDNGGTCLEGRIVETATDELVLYNQYPPFGVVGDSIGVSYVTFRDTVWSPGAPIVLGNRSLWCPTELWIRGTNGGRQTYGCAGNMYLVGDVLYRHTSAGTAPDGPDNPNTEDVLGLVSEKSIIVKYGMMDPADSVRKHVNYANSYNHNGIYIYAAMCALGDAEDTHLDGTFTFEYQHPHKSTQSVWYQGEFFDNIDLHLGQYPPAAPHRWPWPAATAQGFVYPAAYGSPAWPDYPWYNPIWPEYTPYLERGTIHLYGSVAQQRRGFVHRSYEDSADNGYWDIENWHYGQSSENLGVDAPYAMPDNGSGYRKDYHYDSRFVLDPPPDFPEVSIAGQETPYIGLALRFMRPPSGF